MGRLVRHIMGVRDEGGSLLGLRSLGLHWNGFLELTNHQTGGQRFAEETGAF